MNDKWYFAYGSNLKKERLRRRIGEWKEAKKANLKNYELTFAKGYYGHSSGKADIKLKQGSLVRGAVYRLTKEQLDSLDGPEGVALGVYVRIPIVVDIDGDSAPAETYVMKKEISQLKPSEEYLGYILEGLAEHGYSEVIIDGVRKIAAKI